MLLLHNSALLKYLCNWICIIFYVNTHNVLFKMGGHLGYIKWQITEFPTAKALHQSVINLSSSLTKPFC